VQDALRHAQGGTAVGDLAAASKSRRQQAEAVMRAVSTELAWYLEKNTISRAGLASLVEALGSGHHSTYLEGGDVFRDAAARADGNAILGHILGSKDRSRAVAARAARRAGLGDAVVRSMLPGVAAVTMGGLAVRANGGLGDVLGAMPSLGRWSRGNAHADLADILRRGCGAGPYAGASSGAWCAGARACGWLQAARRPALVSALYAHPPRHGVHAQNPGAAVAGALTHAFRSPRAWQAG
jgi:hypothetical protein